MARVGAMEGRGRTKLEQLTEKPFSGGRGASKREKQKRVEPGSAATKPSSAPTRAKASCLYPNCGRALRDAQKRGFDNAVVLDGLGNVAELATANLWMAKDGAAHTAAINGTFLIGITRQRIIMLLKRACIPVYERTITVQELMEADEVFSTGNYGKVQPITRLENRDLQPGPIYKKTRELYWEWAHEG